MTSCPGVCFHKKRLSPDNIPGRFRFIFFLKKKDPVAITCFESHHGLLEKDTDEDGFYLCYAWASRKGTAAETLVNFFKLLQAKKVNEAVDCFAGLTFAPSYRMITDLGENALHTNLAGGASERRFSKYYTKGLEEWINGRYHIYDMGT